MGWLLFLYPFAEIYAYMSFIDAYGFWDAVGVVLLGGFAGLMIMTSVGRSALFSLQADIAQGKNPSNRILNQLAILLGGLLIFIPGLISKVLGLLLVLPGTRHILLLFFRGFLLKQFTSGRIRVFNGGAGFGGGFSRPQGFDHGDIEGMRVERDAQVIDVTPLAVSHEKPKSTPDSE